ncbi:MAG TPA: response regulator [Chthoniobacterales bacterium]|nr:response regulator [Chthoniobacterales bacterium]
MVSRSSEPPSIVVVDDDPQIRDLIGRCLIEFGASVTPCEDAFAAVEVIKIVQPDVVLADLVMPGRYGLDLLYEIRSWGAEHGGDVPAIVITGLHDPDLESEIRKGGFGYLAKPFTPIKLFNTIIQALGLLPPPKRTLAESPVLAHSAS